jgi:glycine oxidase
MDDCLIVGAGVIGLSLAYELARHNQRVHVIDRAPPGREASWAGAGILPPANLATAVHPWDQLRGLSNRMHPQWAQWLRHETGIDTGFRRCGGIYLARSVGEAAVLSGMVDAFQQQGIEIRRLAAEELADVEPALLPAFRDGCLRAAYLAPDESQLRNPDHLQALALACRRRGVRISTGQAVTGFDTRDRRIRAALTESDSFAAENICIASGAWTYRLLRQLDIATGIMPIRGQIVLLRCEQKALHHVLNEGPRYIVPRDDGRVLVGSSEEEAGFDKSTSPAVLEELKQLAYDLVPHLREARVERTWAGLRPGSFDGMPYLGRLPGLDNAFAAAGHFRSGLSTSPATAIVLGQLIRGEEPQVDLTPFRPGRG